MSEMENDDCGDDIPAGSASWYFLFSKTVFPAVPGSAAVFRSRYWKERRFCPEPTLKKAEDVIRDGFLRIQKKYNRETERVQRDRAAVQGLISDLSHQLKTPLANIRLYQELLSNRELHPGSGGSWRNVWGSRRRSWNGF